MLQKKYRLNRNEINVIYKKGQGRNFGDFGLKFLENRAACPRFAVVVPQKVVKYAVERNRLRRVIFDELAKVVASPQTISRDYIIRLYKPIDEKLLRQEINKVFKNV